jgi:hypothetical protein
MGIDARLVVTVYVTGLGETTSQLAQTLWLKGEEMGVFLHRQQRPSRLTHGLRARAVWPAEKFWFAALLEAAAPAIRAEALAVLSDPDEFVRDGFARAGEWTKYDLYLNGYRHRSHAARCPQTIRAVEQVIRILADAHFIRTRAAMNAWAGVFQDQHKQLDKAASVGHSRMVVCVREVLD